MYCDCDGYEGLHLTTGKSWFAGRYIREWKKQHPDGKVIVFSQVAEDKELDKCGITRVLIDEGLVENPYEIKVGSTGSHGRVQAFLRRPLTLFGD